MTPGRLKIWNEDAGEWQYTPGGETVTVKHVVVLVTFADIDPLTGFAPVYLLPVNETVVASWPVITQGFNGTSSASPFTSSCLYGPSGQTGNAKMGDTFDPTGTSASNAADGMISGDPTTGPGNTTTDMFPLGAPVPGGGSVQVLIDFPGSGGAVTVPGTTGALDYHLLIAVA